MRIAYATSGSGPPLVRAAHWLTHLEFEWTSPIWGHWLKELSRDHLLVRYDERGNGLSDWEVEDLSFDAWVRDLEAVVDAVGLDRFALLGVSQGGSVSIEYTVRRPERVSRLILYGAYAQGIGKATVPAEKLEQRQALQTLTQHGWGQDNPAYRQVWTSLFLPGGSALLFRDMMRMIGVPCEIVSIDRIPPASGPETALPARGPDAAGRAHGS